MGSVSRPASVGVAPRATWKYWPRNVEEPNMPTPTATEARIARAVVRSEMIFSGMMGWATLDSTSTSRPSSTTPPPTMSDGCHDHQS